jgi:hypothetical protein
MLGGTANPKLPPLGILSVFRRRRMSNSLIGITGLRDFAEMVGQLLGAVSCYFHPDAPEFATE